MTTGTPLERLLPHLPDARAYNAVRSAYGMSGTVEQVAAASDADLLGIRLVGPKILAEIRAAVQAVLNLPPAPHVAQRGSDVEAWIKRQRDRWTDYQDGRLSEWYVLDNLLDEYRDHADTGTPLDADVQGPHPEGN